MAIELLTLTSWLIEDVEGRYREAAFRVEILNRLHGEYQIS
jgi:hypothetical protein